MGISTIQSYQGSQIFEAVGISKEVIDKYFTNTVSRVGGITIDDIQKDMEDRHEENDADEQRDAPVDRPRNEPAA